MPNPRAIETLLAPYAMAGYPAVALETYEPDRVIAACVAGLFEDPSDRAKRVKRPCYSIAAAGGLRDERDARKKPELLSYPDAFRQVAAQERALLIVLDWQHLAGNAAAYRPMLQALVTAKAQGTIFIFVAPSWTLPNELRHELPVITIPLPSADELTGPLEIVTEATGAKLSDDQAAQLRQAAQGLTQAEAENAFALAALRLNGTQPFSPQTVESEKMRLVRSACMSVEKPAPADSLGGYENLKAYIRNELLPANHDPALRIRALGCAGIPGTGKSLFARVIASLIGEPLIRLDVSSAKGSLVGQSEGNLRHALSAAEAVAPCVLWFDEIEKAIGGYRSSAETDGGTTSGMLGLLLTTMQRWHDEHVPILIVATCNDVTKLPAELTRQGRIEQFFWFDVPTLAERQEIARIHLDRLQCSNSLAEAVAKATPDFTGAEIEGVIRSAARRTGRKITAEAITQAAADVKPLARRRNIDQLREVAADMRRANSDEASPGPGRKIARREDN